MDSNGKADLRWWHYIVFALLLMVIGYVIVSCSALLTRTARADDTAGTHEKMKKIGDSKNKDCNKENKDKERKFRLKITVLPILMTRL
jgi:hypothetical protein